MKELKAILNDWLQERFNKTFYIFYVNKKPNKPTSFVGTLTLPATRGKIEINFYFYGNTLSLDPYFCLPESVQLLGSYKFNICDPKLFMKLEECIWKFHSFMNHS